jgi:hypothetical protein
MKVHVHDTLKESNPRRADFVMATISEALERFANAVQRVDVSLNENGHTATTREFHCRLSAVVGGLGVIVGDSKKSNEHESVSVALDRLLRGIEHRIGQHRAKRHEEPELAISGY